MSSGDIELETRDDLQTHNSSYTENNPENTFENEAFSLEDDVSSRNIMKKVLHTNDQTDVDELVGGCSRYVNAITDTISDFYSEHKEGFRKGFYIVLCVLYLIYFTYCMSVKFGDEGSIRLLVITIFASIFLSFKVIKNYCDVDFNLDEAIEKYKKFFHWFHLAAAVVLTLTVVTYVVGAVGVRDPRNLMSAAGMFCFVFLFYIFSADPGKVRLRPVFWGLAVQFVFALLILRWEVGYRIFQWLGDRLTQFFLYSDSGSQFVFGTDFEHHFFAFKILPMIVFFSSVISLLHYLGVMQFITGNIAWAMTLIMDTSVPETLNASANIFIGQTESPLVILPFLEHMTDSELHAVMTGGFATIAGTTLGAFISFGE